MAVDSRHLRIPLLVLACLLAFGVTAASASSGPQNDWQPRGVLDQDVASLAPVASDPGALYAFGGAKAARSTDSGVTWSAPASACIATQGAADPADAEVAYQACQGAGVMRTRDGGQTWTSVSPVDPESPATTPDITGVAVAATAPSTVYAMATSGDRVYRSDDGGQTWGSVTVPALVNPVITADPANAQRLIITGTPTLPNETGMFITADGGDTWAQLPGSGFKVVFDPTDPARIWADGGTHVDVSTDSGATWGAVPGVPGTPIDIAAAGGDLYVATSAGISRTANDGATWTTAGLPLSSSAAKPAAIAADPAAANRIDVQTQGAGFWSLDYPDSPPASEAYSFFAVDAPSDLTPTSATLSATVAPWFATPASDLPNGVNGDITFSWGSGSGESATAFLNAESPAQRVLTKTITGLAPGTTYTVSASGEFFVGGSGYGASGGNGITFTTPPALKPEILTPPTAAIASGQVNNGAIPVSVKAVAAAGTYPLAATHLGRKVETGAWTALASGATTLPFGRSYQFRAQATDTKGQLSPWTNGPAGTLKLKDDAGTQPTWSANWTHHADSTAVDKTIHASSSGTAAVTFKFTGRSVAVIAPRGPHQASFSAVLDGKKMGVIAPSASFLTARRTVAIYSFSKAGAHTLTLHVVRSSGHTLAELDAFAVLS